MSMQIRNNTCTIAQLLILRRASPNPDQFFQGLTAQCTGRERYPRHGFSEATIICGARSGKDSRIATPTAAFEAALGNHEKYLAKGERAVIPLVAQDMRGSRIAFNYLKSYFTESALLKSMLEDENAFRHGLVGIAQRRADGVLNPAEPVNQRRNTVRLASRQGRSCADQHRHARAGWDHSERCVAVTFNHAIDGVIQNNPKARANPKALAQLDGYNRPLVSSLQVIFSGSEWRQLRSSKARRKSFD